VPGWARAQRGGAAAAKRGEAARVSAPAAGSAPEWRRPVRRRAGQGHKRRGYGWQQQDQHAKAAHGSLPKTHARSRRALTCAPAAAGRHRSLARLLRGGLVGRLTADRARGLHRRARVVVVVRARQPAAEARALPHGTRSFLFSAASNAYRLLPHAAQRCWARSRSRARARARRIAVGVFPPASRRAVPTLLVLRSCDVTSAPVVTIF